MVNRTAMVNNEKEQVIIGRCKVCNLTHNTLHISVCGCILNVFFTITI